MDKNSSKFNICQLFIAFAETRDVEAMTLFYKKIALPCFRMALKYTHNEADAEDAVQLAFVKILENYHRYNYSEDKSDTQLLAWCFSIVINEAKMNHRSEKSRIKRESKTAETKMQTTQPSDHEKHDPELLSLVTQELNLLPEKYKIPLSMKYIEGLKDSEISIALRQNQNTTRSLIKRGIEKLHQRVSTSFAVPTALLFVLIKSQSLQATPPNLNIFIDQNMKSKLMTPNPTKLNPTATFNLTKTIAISASIIACIAVVPLLLGKNPLAESKFFTTAPAISKKTIDKVWKYENENEREFKLLQGQYKWDQREKIIVADYDQHLWIELPIKMESQPLKIELKLKPLVHKTRNGGLTSTFRAIRNDQTLPGRDMYALTKAYTLESYDFITINAYLVNNTLYSFYKDQCISRVKYNIDTTNANISIILQNYGINQISVKTIDNVPAFIDEESQKDESEKSFNINVVNATSANITLH